MLETNRRAESEAAPQRHRGGVAALGCAAILLLALGAPGCSGGDEANSSAKPDSSAAGDAEGAKAPAAREGGSDAPPFNFAGETSSKEIDEAFAMPADAGSGSLELADGRKATIALSSCPELTSDFFIHGRGETSAGQRFLIEISREDGSSGASLKTTHDPSRVVENTSPVWSTTHVFDSTVGGREVELRNFWLLGTIVLSGENGPRPVSGPGNLATDIHGRIDAASSKSEALSLIEEASRRQAAKDLAAKVKRLAVTCS